ncbi:MAG: hypothetical protein ACK4E8_06065 [Lacibacter sp.]
MKENQDPIRAIAEMRELMERSSKFLSLSGRAGVFAGVYALSGALVAYLLLGFNPDRIVYSAEEQALLLPQLEHVLLVAALVLVLAVGTAIVLSYQTAVQRGERLANPVARRVVVQMAVPLVSGGLLLLLLLSKGWIGWLAPFSLIFYGLALYQTGTYTYNELKSLGLLQVVLGLAGAWLPAYGLWCWAAGFGVAHILFGLFLHNRYQRSSK